MNAKTALLFFLALGTFAYCQQGQLARSQPLTSAPAAGSQATVTAAAQTDGSRWVFDQVCFSGGATSAPVGTAISLNVRDGASGAGTVKTSFAVGVPASTGQNVVPVCMPLGFTGSANTAATAEWSAGLANEFESVTLMFHKAQ